LLSILLSDESNLLETLSLIPDPIHQVLDIYFMAIGDGAEAEAMRLAERLRTELPSLRLQLHCGGGGMKSQIKKADKSGATLALILGEEELNQGVVTVKHLRAEQAQQTIAMDSLAAFLVEQL
jgi:histidyl-tRNA synthetase